MQVGQMQVGQMQVQNQPISDRNRTIGPAKVVNFNHMGP